MHTCKFCNAEIVTERYELGYDYCMALDCVTMGMQVTHVVVVGVHKSNPQVLRVDSVEANRNVSYMVR